MSRRQFARHHLPMLVAVAVAVAALALQLRLPLNADAQWILNVAGRVLGGERLYRDILEINPPLVIWLQMPVAWVAREIGVPAAVLYRVTVVLGGLLLTWLTRLIRWPDSRDQSMHARWMPALTLGVLLLLPGGAFGQREQLISMLLLPAIVLAAAREEGRTVRPPLACCAGVAAGVGIALKPYFVVTWACLWAYRTFTIKRPPYLGVEDFSVIVVGLVYVASVAIFAPAFFDLVRTFAGPYAAYTTMTRAQILFDTAAVIWFVVAVVAWRVRRDPGRDPLGAGLAIAAAAGLLAAVWQGKGWTYHFLPAVSWSVLLGVHALASRPRPGIHATQRVARLASAAVLALSWVPLVGGAVAQLRLTELIGIARPQDANSELQHAVQRELGARSILVLSSDMTGSQPWIGELGLLSRNSWSCLWVPAVAYQTRWNGNPRVPLRAISDMGDAERVAFASVLKDFVVRPPDLLVVETREKNESFTGYPGGFDHLAYYGMDKRFASCLSHYRLDAEPRGFRVFRRVVVTPTDSAGDCA